MLDYIILVVTYNRVERCFKKTLTMLKENKVPKDIPKFSLRASGENL
jgi:hypothetical protein